MSSIYPTRFHLRPEHMTTYECHGQYKSSVINEWVLECSVYRHGEYVGEEELEKWLVKKTHLAVFPPEMKLRNIWE